MKLTNIDYFGYFRKFLISLPFIALLIWVWFYISVMTGSEFSDVLETTNLTFNIFSLLLKQNIVAISVYSIIMLAVAIILIKKGDENKFIIIVIEIWLTVIFIFVYISITMQIVNFAAALATMLSISSIMFGINMLFAYTDNKYYKKKLYFLLFLLASFLVRLLLFDGSISTFNLLTDTFVINFFFVLILGFYITLRIFLPSVYSVFIFIAVFPLTLVAFFYGVYTIFYSIAAVFSGFNFSEIYDNFFLGAFVKLFNLTLSDDFPVTLAGLLSLFLTILGVTSFIVSFEEHIYFEDNGEDIKIKEKNPNSSHKIIFLKHDNLWAIAGAIILIVFVAQMNFELKNSTPQKLQAQSEPFQFKTKIDLKNKPITVFSTDSLTYVITENKKNKFELNKISKDNIFIGKQDFPKFNKILPTKNKDTIAFIEFNDTIKQIDFYFFDVKNEKQYLTKKYKFDDLSIYSDISMKLYTYKHKNFILYSEFNKFGILDFTGKIVYQGILEKSNYNAKHISYFYNDIYTEVKNDTLYAFSATTTEWFKINLKNYSVNKFNSLIEVFSPPCLDFRIDTIENKLITKYILTKDSAKFIDTLDSNNNNFILAKNSFTNSYKIFHVNNNNLQEIGFDKTFIFKNDTIIIFNENTYNEDNKLILYSRKDTTESKVPKGMIVKQIELKGNTVNCITEKKNYFLRYILKGKK